MAFALFSFLIFYMVSERSPTPRFAFKYITFSAWFASTRDRISQPGIFLFVVNIRMATTPFCALNKSLFSLPEGMWFSRNGVILKSLGSLGCYWNWCRYYSSSPKSNIAQIKKNDEDMAKRAKSLSCWHLTITKGNFQKY